MNEIFIITKKGVVVDVTNNSETMLRLITDNKNILNQKEYFLENVFSFATEFIKPTSKYKTFNKYIVYKYDILYEKLINHKSYKTNKQLPNYLLIFNKLLKTDEFKIFIRIKKFERLLED